MRTTYAPKQIYTGTGSLAIYTFAFKIEALSQLLVVVVDAAGLEVKRVRGTDATYLSTVVFNAVAGGGTVTLLANLPSGYKMALLQANDAPTQSYQWANQTSFNLKRFENAMDFIVGAVQRLSFRATQAFRIHDTDNEATFNPQMPSGIASKGDCVLAISDDGTGMKFGPTTAQIFGASAAAVGSAAAAAASQAAALASQTAANTSATAAATSANAANTSAVNANASATAANTSAVNAGVSEVNALAAKTAAENAANSTIWSNVVFLTSASSPRAITNADKGTLFVVDCSASNFVFNLPQISTLTLVTPWTVGIKKSDPSGNIVTINRAGTDLIDSGTSVTVSVPSAGITLVPNATPNPDTWTGVLFGAGGGSAAPDLSGTRAAPTPISAAAGIAFSGTYYNNIKFLQSNGGAITVGSSPQIAAGNLVGQELLLDFCSDVNTIELNDGNGLKLNMKFVSADERKLCFFWNGTVWSEKYRI